MGGGIAAYKAVDIVRELGRRGADVRTAMTRSGARFVGPMTLAGLTGSPPVLDLWDANYAGEVHVELGEWADAVVVAPATMNLLARLANGMADDVVLATLACARGAVVHAPAMFHRMWGQASTQRNVASLVAAGHLFCGPVEGSLANSEVGMGRMAEPCSIVDAVVAALAPPDLMDRHIVVSAGPTLEDLDPVRFLGNRSTGRMGFALAGRAAARGARVTLVAGPVDLATPARVERLDVRSARQMHAAVTGAGGDVVIMAAAVADYRPADVAEQKLKKQDGELTLELTRNPDILLELGQAREGSRPVLVGFALETEALVEHARGKLERKGCDLVVANHASVGFGGQDNVATLVTRDSAEELPMMSKHLLADRILDRALELLRAADAS